MKSDKYGNLSEQFIGLIKFVLKLWQHLLATAVESYSITVITELNIYNIYLLNITIVFFRDRPFHLDRHRPSVPEDYDSIINYYDRGNLSKEMYLLVSLLKFVKACVFGQTTPKSTDLFAFQTSLNALNPVKKDGNSILVP